MAADGRSPAIWQRSPCATSIKRSASLPCLPSATEPRHPAFDEAEALLLSRLADVTLAMLSADFHKRLAGRSNRHRLEIAHAT